MLHADGRLKRIIHDGDAEATVELASELGVHLAREDLSKTAIRNIFGMVRQIEAANYQAADLQRRVVLLKPKLAYAKARQPRLDLLTQALDEAIGLVRGGDVCWQDFRNFAQFFEAIVAYHYAAHAKASRAGHEGGRR
jgi:CRISPR-associated protein Csm2